MLPTPADATNPFQTSNGAPATMPMAEVPKIVRKQEAFNERLEAVLRGTANAYGAVATEFWLLDTATKELGCRAIWEKTEAIPAEARPLATADADVAALSGGVVVLEHPAEILQWHCHRPAVSAVCLPVSSDTTIHGTVWLFFDRQKQFCNRELEMLEIVAGRLAVEIERDALLNGSTEAISPTTKSFENRFNAANAEQSELEIATWRCQSTEAAESLWCLLPNGKTFAVSSSVVATPGTTDEQASSTIERTNSLVYELAQNAEDAGELLTELNRQLIADKQFNSGVTIAVALLDSEGVGTVATAGPSVLLQVRAATLQSITGETMPIAWDADAVYNSNSIELMVRERLILLSGTPQLSCPLLERQLTDTFRAPTADAHREMTAQSCVERLLRVKSEELGAITAIRRV